MIKLYNNYTNNGYKVLYLFEYDEKKSQMNKSKHGIDFIEAQQLWEDENRLRIRAKSDDEERYAMIGQLETKIWIAIYTVRENKIRIISVRRARPKEEELYHES